MAIKPADIMMRIGADIEPLTTGLNKGSKKLDSFSSKSSDAAKKIAKIGAASIAAGAAIGIALVKQSLAAVDAQAKLAKQLGTTSASIAVLDRAAAMSGVSMAQMETAGRTLSIKMSEVADGTGTAVDAFEKLGLTVDDLEGLSLDQKIAAINRAMVENVDVVDRAGVAADIFGSRAGLAIAQMSPETIAEASKQIEAFGLNISEIDATKIEMANDAIDSTKLAMKGLAQEGAVQIAPILKGISDELFNMSAEGQDFQRVVENIVNVAVVGAGFIGNAFRGVQVVIKGLELAMKGVGAAGIASALIITKSFDAFIGVQKKAINELIDSMNVLIPKSKELQHLEINPSSATEKLEASLYNIVESIGQTKKELYNLGMEELPSTALENWVEEVTVAAQEATERVVEEAEKQKDAVVNTVKEQAVDELAVLSDTLSRKEAMLGDHYTNVEASEEEHKSKLSQITDAWGSEQTSALSSMLGDLSTLMNTENKKMFELGKKAAMGQAVIDSIAGAQKAFTSLAGIPFIGPALGIAAAGTALAAGAVRVGQINSTSFGSSSVPSSSGGASASPVSAPAMSGGGGSSSGGGGASSTLFVEGINADSLFTGEAVRSLAEKLVEYQEDGGQVVIS